MESSGFVKKIKKNKITISIYKESACSHCSKCSDSKKITNEISFNYSGNENIEEGDIITFEMEDKKVYKAAGIVYGIPIIAMFLGYYIGNLLKLSEGISVLASFVGICISFVGIYFYDKLVINNSMENLIEIIKIEKKGE